MEVLLKRTKINKTIFNQIKEVNIWNFDLENIIGYCLVNNKEYSLYYDPKLNVLMKGEIYKTFERDDYNTDYISYGFSMVYQVDNVVETINLFNKVKEVSFAKGQIYL